jgi:PEP-CTERM motif
MRRLLMAVALCAAGSAWGSPTQFVFDVNGSGFETYGAADTVHCPGGVCSTTGEALNWTGTLTVVTDDNADGIYGTDGLVSITLDSSLGDFTAHGAIDPFLQVGQIVTLAGGQVTALEGGYNTPDHLTTFMFDGRFGIDFSSVAACDQCDFSSATAVLTPASITAAVPEPSTYALMLAGLGVAGFVARRRRSA